MPKKTALNRPDRILAALLATIWIGAGLVVIGFGLIGGRWLYLLLGIPAVGFGLLWVRVSVEGRKLPWPAGRLLWLRKPR